VTIKRDQTLGDLKNMLLGLNLINSFNEINIKKLRIREIKKDYFFGGILKQNNKSLRKF
jgi:hypothetical protein